MQSSPVAVQISARPSLRLRCTVDRRREEPCSRSTRFRLASGRHTISAAAVDSRGRRSAARSVVVVVPFPAPRAVHVGGAPVGIATLGTDVWVSGGTSGVVSRIDGSTKAVVATVRVGGQLGGGGAGPSGVWVSVYDGGEIARIDPARNAVTGRFAVGGRPTGLAVSADGAVWAGNLDGYLTRIDPETSKTTRIALPSGVSMPLVARGLVWAGLQDGSVVAVDPSTNAIAGRAARIGTDVDALADTPAGIWLSTFSSAVGLLDPGSRTISHRRTLPGRGSGITYAGGSIWSSDYDDGYVLRLDPRTGALVGATRTGSQPRESAAAGGVLWVLDQADGDVSPVPLR